MSEGGAVIGAETGPPQTREFLQTRPCRGKAKLARRV